MLAQLSKAVLAVAVTGVLSVSAWAQAQPAQGQAQAQTPGQKNWKDRAEYDLVQEINKETDANKKLAQLNSWKEKYPASEFKIERMQMYVVLYQQLGQAPNMLQAAKDLVGADPKNLFGLSSINLLTVSMANTSPEALDSGEKAANGLLSNLDAIFAPDKKPANVDDAAWKKERTNMEALGHTTLGWVAMQRKNFDQAEQEFTKVLQVNPANAQVSYWLGTSVLGQKKPEKQATALFHFARAVSVEGQPPAALPEGPRKQISAYLEKIYTTYHGDKTGLPELLAMAKTTALPPADLKIEDANSIATRKHEEFVSNNPQLAVWMGLKQALTADNGEQYFESSVKGAAVPKLKAKVISQKPERRPTTVVVGIEKPDQPEATLKFETPLSGPADPGTEIEFEGVPSEFTKSPFNVTFDVDKEKLTGWPKAAAPAPKRAAPARKKK